MDGSKRNFVATLICHIIQKNDWTKPLGHYIYYKGNMTKPSNKLLKYANYKCIQGLISNINKGHEIDDTSFHETKKVKKHIVQVPTTNVIEQEDAGSYIQLSSSYKFTGTNPYNDLIKPDNMSDEVYKDMIYMRSQFSKSKFSKFQYSFPENFVIS
jgi:hypothetical protein